MYDPSAGPGCTVFSLLDRSTLLSRFLYFSFLILCITFLLFTILNKKKHCLFLCSIIRSTLCPILMQFTPSPNHNFVYTVFFIRLPLFNRVHTYYYALCPTPYALDGIIMSFVFTYNVWSSTLYLVAVLYIYPSH